MNPTTIVLLFAFILQTCERKNEVLACGKLPTSLSNRLAFTHTTHVWPWHVAIYYQVGESDATYQCGGTLISSRSVLTAAHCVKISAEFVVVSLGRLLLNANESSSPFVKVAEIILHPEYSSDNEDNDIAIIVLATSAIFNSYVQPVCLWPAGKPDLSEIVDKYGTVVGWGITETGMVSNELREASLSVVDTFTCLKSNRDLFGRFLSYTNFCAGNRNGTGVCAGDSGGSMTFEENGTFYIRGIVSIGATKKNDQTQMLVCDPMQYALFTDVVQYLSWIRSSEGIEECAKRIRCDWSADNNRSCTVVLDSNIHLSSARCRIIFDEIPNSAVTELKISGHSDVVPDWSDAVAHFENLDSLVFANISLNMLERAPLTPFKNIRKLNLASNSIGRFDAADIFDDLNDLVELYLRANKLTELHPNLFEHLNNLQILDLARNNLRSLPANIFRNNGKLRELDLAQNLLKQLPGDLFENLISVKRIGLWDNQLETIPPGLFRNNGKVTELYLSQNQLKELSADLLENLVDLETFYIRTNGIGSLPANIFRNNRKLQALDISENQLTELHGDLFENLINLDFLNVFKNELSALPGDIFRNNVKLRELSFSQNLLKELPVDIFNELPNLQIIVLSYNQLETIPAGIFRNNGKLQKIRLGFNKIKKIEPNFLLATRAGIREFGLQGNVCIDESCDSCDAESLSKIFEKIERNCQGS